MGCCFSKELNTNQPNERTSLLQTTVEEESNKEGVRNPDSVLAEMDIHEDLLEHVDKSNRRDCSFATDPSAKKSSLEHVPSENLFWTCPIPNHGTQHPPINKPLSQKCTNSEEGDGKTDMSQRDIGFQNRSIGIFAGTINGAEDKIISEDMIRETSVQGVLASRTEESEEKSYVINSVTEMHSENPVHFTQKKMAKDFSCLENCVTSDIEKSAIREKCLKNRNTLEESTYILKEETKGLVDETPFQPGNKDTLSLRNETCLQEHSSCFTSNEGHSFKTRTQTFYNICPIDIADLEHEWGSPFATREGIAVDLNHSSAAEKGMWNVVWSPTMEDGISTLQPVKTTAALESQQPEISLENGVHQHVPSSLENKPIREDLFNQDVQTNFGTTRVTGPQALTSADGENQSRYSLTFSEKAKNEKDASPSLTAPLSDNVDLHGPGCNGPDCVVINGKVGSAETCYSLNTAEKLGDSGPDMLGTFLHESMGTTDAQVNVPHGSPSKLKCTTCLCSYDIKSWALSSQETTGMCKFCDTRAKVRALLNMHNIQSVQSETGDKRPGLDWSGQVNNDTDTLAADCSTYPKEMVKVTCEEQALKIPFSATTCALSVLTPGQTEETDGLSNQAHTGQEASESEGSRLKYDLYDNSDSLADDVNQHLISNTQKDLCHNGENKGNKNGALPADCNSENSYQARTELVLPDISSRRIMEKRSESYPLATWEHLDDKGKICLKQSEAFDTDSDVSSVSIAARSDVSRRVLHYSKTGLWDTCLLHLSGDDLDTAFDSVHAAKDTQESTESVMQQSDLIMKHDTEICQEDSEAAFIAHNGGNTLNDNRDLNNKCHALSPVPKWPAVLENCKCASRKNSWPDHGFCAVDSDQCEPSDGKLCSSAECKQGVCEVRDAESDKQEAGVAEDFKEIQLLHLPEDWSSTGFKIKDQVGICNDTVHELHNYQGTVLADQQLEQRSEAHGRDETGLVMSDTDMRAVTQQFASDVIISNGGRKTSKSYDSKDTVNEICSHNLVASAEKEVIQSALNVDPDQIDLYASTPSYEMHPFTEKDSLENTETEEHQDRSHIPKGDGNDGMLNVVSDFSENSKEKQEKGVSKDFLPWLEDLSQHEELQHRFSGEGSPECPVDTIWNINYSDIAIESNLLQMAKPQAFVAPQDLQAAVAFMAAYPYSLMVSDSSCLWDWQHDCSELESAKVSDLNPNAKVWANHMFNLEATGSTNRSAHKSWKDTSEISEDPCPEGYEANSDKNKQYHQEPLLPDPDELPPTALTEQADMNAVTLECPDTVYAEFESIHEPSRTGGNELLQTDSQEDLREHLKKTLEFCLSR
nr:PREDICTED: la-related protein 4B isoform X2 [Lepisosteus oculatus]